MNNLIDVLQNTLSNNNAKRKEAEQLLFQYSRESGYAKELLRIIFMEELDLRLHIKTAASQKLLSISCSDFPDVWTELIDNLAAAMQQRADDSDRLLSCLSIVDDLCMKYRHELKSNQLLEIKLLLDKIFMPLTKLFVAYSNGTPMDTSRITNLNIMSSIFEKFLSSPFIRDNKASLNQYLLIISDNLIASLSQPMSCDNCYVLKCLYRCITYLQPETIASKCLAFTEIVQSLIEVALKKTILVDTLAVHFGFETICWFIKKAYILPNGSPYQFYHSYVFETIYNLLKSENRDFVPYALQLACALVEQYGHEIEQGNDRIPTDDYEAFFGNLINSNIADSGVNVPAFVMVLRSYLRRLPRIALSGENATAIGKFTTKFISSELNDQHAFLLACQLIRYLDRVNGLRSHSATSGHFCKKKRQKKGKKGACFKKKIK